MVYTIGFEMSWKADHSGDEDAEAIGSRHFRGDSVLRRRGMPLPELPRSCTTIRISSSAGGVYIVYRQVFP